MIVVVPANEASWTDLTAVLGSARCHGAPCYCQRFKLPGRRWAEVGDGERADRLREQTACEQPGDRPTSGLVAYLDGEPVGWCSVEPRTAFPGLLNSRLPWAGRTEDKADDGVWVIACLITRVGYRRRGVSGVLAAAAVGFARERGARALEAYGMITNPAREITWGELHVGSANALADAGFTEVSRPSKRRVVMRVEL
ncbi:GNAT family N-acetyltransferase [Actinophytocola oryzae]|uniref:Acetyltransferase (GNAT) family protein n=1 Tax=Actinophytocola oryzae TaxID=502181 RepID=A0A4R7VR31_9PSEU|nr:GNAT family N-acetyltransferase [Actinophytocola oryzae]TDV52154.1 acetyltransferase (GNAT) family protein [Actinophytocola oryzae]